MLDDAEYAEIQAEALASVSPPEVAAEPAPDAIASDDEQDSAAPITSDAEQDEPADEEEPKDDSESAEPEPAGDTEPTSSPDEIPTADDINSRFARVPKEARAEMIGLADRLRSQTDAVTTLGGDTGVKVFTPLAGIMQKDETTEDERMGAIASLVTANPTTATHMFADAAETLLGAPDLRVIGNQIAMNTFGATVEELHALSELKKGYENATPEHIKELLTLEKAGLINTEEDMELFRANYGGTELYEQQQTEIQTLKAQLQEVIKNPPKPQEVVVNSTALNEFESEFVKRFEASTAPPREMANWGKDSPIAQIVTKAIMSDLKDDPDYKTAVNTIKQLGSFNLDHMAIAPALTRLALKARGRYQEAVAGISKELRKTSETSHNAKLKEKTEDTKPKAVPLPGHTAPDFRPADDDLDNIWNDYRGLISNKQAAAARSI